MSASISFGESRAFVLHHASMNERPVDRERGERIRYVREDLLGLSAQEEFASLISQRTGASLSRGAVGNWEQGRGVATKNLQAIAEVAGISFDWLAHARGEKPVKGDLHGQELYPSDADAVFISGEQKRYSGARDVEKAGIVAAGDDEDGEFEFAGLVNEYVSRPRGLFGRLGVFAMEIISESMYPAYRKGDVVFCDRATPSINDDIVIEMFPQPGFTFGKAYVKRLVRRTKAALIVEQFNPRKELTFDPYAIKHLWRVVPNRELHGY